MPKVNRRLTEIEIKNAKAGKKAYRLYDEGGLTLLVRPSGTKVWQYPYNINNRRNIYTIGKIGEVSSTEARQLRDQARALVNEGIDPNQRKKDLYRENLDAVENNFKAVALEWYGKQTWAEKHAKNILSRLEKDVFPVIGHKPAKDISARDIIAVLKTIESRGALDVAKRINQYCVAIFDYAIMLDLCDNNPATGRSRIIEAKKTIHRPHLTENELPDFLKALYGKNDPTLTTLAIKLLVLTFIRPGELRFANWDEFNEEKAVWEVPGERMKKGRDHIVPLSRQAIDILEEIKGMGGDDGLLFPGQKRVTQPISDVALIKAVKKLTGGKAVPHGFRHTASTILNEKGFNPDHIERQLAHVEDNKVRGTYNKAEYLSQRTEMMQWWADYLDSQRR